MREIKFRGKAIDSGDLVYGFLLLTDDRAYIHPIRDGLDFDDVDFGCGFIQIDLKTVGQFTGLRDKNGKEIFEWDRVRIWNGNKGYISYSDGYFRIGNKRRIIDCYEWEDFEVIGNIHENPELLK